MAQIDLGNVIGPQGPQGETGQTGADGKSAYQAAVDGGYTGTEEDFNLLLATLGNEQTGGESGGGSGWTLLWTNPRPTGSFVGRTLTVTGLDGYTSFLIVSKYGTGDVTTDPSHGDVCYVPSGTMLYTVGVVSGGDSGAMSYHFRQVTITPAESTMTLSNGQRIADGESLSTSGQYCIPLYILGATV